ncbi:TPA: hypothetical protein ACH3X1_016292 [Trebouxia sp. C0004]
MHEVASLVTSTNAFSGIVHTHQACHGIAQSRRAADRKNSESILTWLARWLRGQGLIEPVHLAGVDQRLETLSYTPIDLTYHATPTGNLSQQQEAYLRAC